MLHMSLTKWKSILDKKFNLVMMKFITIVFILFLIVYPVSATFNVSPQGGSFPVSVGDPFGIRGAVYVGDINLDGVGEMVVETYSNLYLYNTSTSTLQQISSLATPHHTIMKMPDPIAGNLAGDDEFEIVFGDKTTKKLYAWNSDLSQTFGPLTLGGDIYSTPALADVDNDGYSEIAIGSDGNLVYLVDGDGTIFPNWPVAVGGIIHSKPAFGDIDGDGELEIVFNALDSKVYAFKVDGSTVPGWPQSISSFGMTFEYSSPAVGDLDDDGSDEVVVSACKVGQLNTGRLIVFDGDGSNLWDAPIKLNYYSSPVIGNIDFDAENEIVMGCVFNVYAFEHDGTPKWTNSIGSNGQASSTLLKDITGDGVREVFVSLWDGGDTLYGWYGDGTSFMQESAGGKVYGVPSIYDFDDDGLLELTVGTSAGKIQAWNIEFIPVYPTVSVTSPANPSLFVQGDIIPFTGIGSDPDGAIMLSLWSSNITGNLGSGESITVDSSTLNVGYHNISYKVYDRDGLSNTSSIIVKVGLKPITSIVTPSNGITPLQWTNLTFNASATDSDGTIADVQWKSDVDGVLGNQYTFSYQDLSIGTHTITFTATDDDGLNTSSQIGITIREPKPPFCQIVKPTTNSEYDVGETIYFEGSSSDTDGTVETHEWYSSIDGYLGNNSSFSISNLSSGTHLISFNVVDNDDLTWTDQITLKIKGDTITGGGGSGGGGFTGEDYDNIEVNEYVTSYVLNGKTIWYDFKLVDPILKIEYTALRSAGKITAVVEVLQDTSSLISVPAPDFVYKNVNIFVGLYGYASEQNIRDATVYFRVKKDWINSNDIDESTVALYNYRGEAWIEQPTELDYEDDTHVYYKSHVNGFNSFAISGREWVEEVPVQTGTVDGNTGNGNGTAHNPGIGDWGNLSIFYKINNVQLLGSLLILCLIIIILALILKKTNN